MQHMFEMYCHPWGLEEEGIDESIGRLAGEIGVDRLCVSAALPEVTRLAARGSSKGRLFQCPAAVHFQPSGGCYSRGRIRPVAAAWMKSRNPLERIVRAAEKHRLKVRVLIQPLEGASLVERHAHAARLNVYGDSAAAVLCAGHPDVREYLAGLVTDLSQHYAPEAIELAGLQDGARPVTTTNAFALLGAADSNAASAYFKLCFCAACRQRAVEAGLDVAVAEAAARRTIEQALAAEGVASAQDRSLQEDWVTLEAYRRLQEEGLISLVKSLRAGCATPLWWRVPTPEVGTERMVPPSDAYTVVTSFGAAMPAVVRRLASRGESVALVQDLWSTWPCDPAAVVASTREAAGAGYASIGFSWYGDYPPPLLDGVRQAIRYARRET